MSVNLDELQEELPDVGAAGQAPSVLYSIDDDLFGLTEKQKELRQIAADFAQKNVVRADLLEMAKQYISECQEKKKQSSTVSTATDNSSENRDYVKELFEEKNDKKDEIKEEREILKELGKHGLLGITVKQDYGGQEGGLIENLIVQQELSRAFGMTAFQYNSHFIDCIHPINRFGTNEQKRYYLPKLCSGEHVGIMAISTSEDKLALKKLQAVKQEDYYILNGVATSAKSNADIFIAYTRTNRNKDSDVTAFIIEKSFEGFSRSAEANRFVFNNCKVPAKNLLGEKNNGQMILLSCFTIGKVVLAGGTVGIMQDFCNAAFKYANTSNKFDEYKDKIAEMYTKLRASESYLYTIARSCDNGYINVKDSIAINSYCSKNASILSLNYLTIIGNNGILSINSHGLLMLANLKLYEDVAGNLDNERDIITSVITKECTEGRFNGNFH